MTSTSPSRVKIRAALFPADKEVVTNLFIAYSKSIPVKLDFQGFEQELAGLPGKYADEKGGAVYLAYTSPSSSTASRESNGIIPSSNESASTTHETSTYLGLSSSTPQETRSIIGVVALRPFQTSNSIPTCELKRLYLTPSARGLGVSKLLMDVVIARARELGYKEMILDTLKSMKAARKLYEGYGFREIGSYYESVEDAVFYGLKL